MMNPSTLRLVTAAEENRQVACPRCHAQPGKFCYTAKGVQMKNVHRERFAEASKSRLRPVDGFHQGKV